MTTRLLMTADAVGGVWQYATDLARALRPHGVETTIAVLGPTNNLPLPFRGEGRSGEAARERGSHWNVNGTALPLSPALSPEGEREVDIITNLPLDWLSPGPDPVIAAGEAIAALARELRADIVHLNSPTLAARARFDQPVVAVAHGCVATWWRAAHGSDPDPGYRWQADLMRAGLLAADAAVAPSAAFAYDLQRTYALPATPIAIHNGRSIPSPLQGRGTNPGLEPREGEGQCTTPAPHAFTAGRLWDRVKNTAVLDRAAARLSVPFRAAGPLTGPHGETVAPKHLYLLGNLSADQIAAELARQPVFVSAASFEPFGLAVLEAAQAGCALVLSDTPTFRELWNDAALSAVIEELIADPIQREALGHAARERATRYTPEATAAAMAALYARLLRTDRKAAA